MDALRQYAMQQLRPFWKMHALGNDFIVINNLDKTFNTTASYIKKLASRKRGIGFDQCLLIEPARKSSSDYFYRIFNANGGEVGQCGNGARCLMKWIVEIEKLSKHKSVRLETISTELNVQKVGDNYALTVPEPEFSAPFSIDYSQKVLTVYSIDVGNPHSIIFVETLDDWTDNSCTKLIKTHQMLADTNISFVRLQGQNSAYAHVYERGVGFTEACGSAALAIGAAIIKYAGRRAPCTITQPGGSMEVHWGGKGASITVTGPASYVYRGEIKE